MFQGLDYFTLLQTAVAGLMHTYSQPFWRIGMNVFYASAVIRIIVTGWEIAFRPGSIEDSNYLFGKTLFQIAAGLTIITFYETPVPGIGYSFSDFFVAEMASLAAILDASIVQVVVTTLDGILAKFVAPGYTELLANIIYFAVFFFVTLAKVVSLIIIGFSLFAQAVLVLLGPLFCSLFLVPHFKRYFVGWLDALVQYSFLQVTAYAYMLVGITLLKGIATSVPMGLTSDLYLTYGAMVLIFLLTYLGGFFMIPALNASIFSGAASSSFVNITRKLPIARSLV
jgi:type IV secretory pathway VirB6-like protein